jgi:CheY-like chemotaxis protein
MTPNALPTSFRILVIDDTPAIHDDFRKILAFAPIEKSGKVREFASAIFGTSSPTPDRTTFTIDSALQGEVGLALLLDAKAAGQPYAMAFVDMRMPPGWDGIETTRRLWAADPAVQIVICTAYSDTSWDENLRQLGHSDSFLILKKPFDSVEALQLAHALTMKWALARQNRAQVAQLNELVRLRTTELDAAEERFKLALNATRLPPNTVSET